MLDFLPQGTDEINTVAAYLIGTGVVLLGVLIATGFVYFAMGRNGGVSRAQERGFKMVGVGTASVMVLSSLGGAIVFGIGQGNESLMPEDAQQQAVTVEREAPTTTCSETAVRDFNEESESTSEQERQALLDSVTDGEVVVNTEYSMASESSFYVSDEAVEENRTDATTAVGEVEEIERISWYPDGSTGNCSADNETSAADTVVEFEVQVRGSSAEYTLTTAE